MEIKKLKSYETPRVEVLVMNVELGVLLTASTPSYDEEEW